jgi:hypothetical protein
MDFMCLKAIKYIFILKDNHIVNLFFGSRYFKF